MEKYNAIKDFVDHGGNKNRIALNLGITRHQVNVLIRKYKEKGKSGFWSLTVWERKNLYKH